MNEQPDPYQAPASSMAEPVLPYPLDRAGAGRRFLGFVIDYLACIFFIIRFLFVLDFLLSMTTGEEGLDLDEGPETALRDRLVGLLFYFSYYLVFEGLFSRTIGKLVTGTVVVDESGFPPSFLQVLGRSLARLIPFDPLSFLGSSTRGWHDSLSGTYVVRSRRREDEPAFEADVFRDKIGKSFLGSQPLE